MKKTLLTLFLASAKLFALYNGSPAAPETIDTGMFLSSNSSVALKTGYQGDFLFDKRLHTFEGSHGAIDQFEAISNQGVVTLNIIDSYEVYGSAGAMKVFLSNRPHSDHKRREYQMDDHLTWGVGGRAILFHWAKTFLGIDGKYQRNESHVKWNTLNGESLAPRGRFTYEEWQVGAGIAQNIDRFTPYAALRYSDPHAKLRGLNHQVLSHDRFVLKTNRHWGLSLGCTLSSAKSFDMTVEVRMFDEEALTLAGNVKF
jgi:hypothetical protein